MRALRVDKMTYAALEATLQSYLAGRAADIPVAGMIAAAADEIGERASQLVATITSRELSAAVVDGVSTIGGGSAPGSELPTRLIELTHTRLSAASLEERLRALDPPVIARILNDRVVLDLRTVLPAQDASLGELLSAIND
jgi:L-seryl-tRNA(Ser) seleniumtransferase